VGRRLLRVALWVVLLLLAVAAAVLTWWLVTLPDAEPGPVTAVLEDDRLEVTREDGVLTLRPDGGDDDEAVVFLPGAGVPPEAYLPNWAPVVTESGLTVHIPDVPLRFAILARGRADDVRARFPATRTWWLGGHSLGGATASFVAADAEPGQWRGVVFWASYPADSASLADRDDLTVVSVAGAEDGLSTPADVAERRDLLPADAQVTVLDGVVHAQFGAYGTQRGDGTPTVDDATAATAIAEATAAGLSGAGG
jgi:hypothetical protein